MMVFRRSGDEEFSVLDMTDLLRETYAKRRRVKRKRQEFVKSLPIVPPPKKKQETSSQGLRSGDACGVLRQGSIPLCSSGRPCVRADRQEVAKGGFRAVEAADKENSARSKRRAPKNPGHATPKGSVRASATDRPPAE